MKCIITPNRPVFWIHFTAGIPQCECVLKSVADCEQGLLLSQGREFKESGRIIATTITESLYPFSFSNVEYVLAFPLFISSIECDWVMKPGKARNWHKRVTSP